MPLVYSRAHSSPSMRNIAVSAESQIDGIESQENALEFFTLNAVNSVEESDDSGTPHKR